MSHRDATAKAVCPFALMLCVVLGCAPQVPTETVRLTLEWLPWKTEPWRTLIVFWSGNELLKELPEFEVDSGGIVQDVERPNGATAFSVFLMGSLIDSPLYFWEFELVPGLAEYSCRFWLSYDSYFLNSTIRFGISEQAIVDLEEAGTYLLDFDLAPYYLFRDTDPFQEMRRSIYESDGSELLVIRADHMEAVVWGHQTRSVTYTYSSQRGTSGTIDHDTAMPYLLFEPLDYGVSTTVSLEHLRTREVPVSHLDLILATDDPQTLYAYSGYSERLYRIDPTRATATDIVTVQKYVRAMSYSEPDGKLYLGGELAQQARFFVVDPATGSSTTVSYGDEYSAGLTVDPTGRRLYVASYENGTTATTLEIRDLDNPASTIASAPIPWTADIAYSPTARAIVGLTATADEIFVLSVANDVIQDTGLRYAAPSASDVSFSLSGDGAHVVCSTAAGHVVVLGVSDLAVAHSLDHTPIDEVVDARLSADGSAILVVDQYVYQYRLSDLAYVTRYWLPSSSSFTYYRGFAVGPDDVYLAGFSGETRLRVVYPDPSVRRSLLPAHLPWFTGRQRALHGLRDRPS